MQNIKEEPTDLEFLFLCSIYTIRRYQLIAHICDRVNEIFGIFPAKAWVGNGLTVAVLTNLLVARLDVALDHNALDQPV